MADQPPPTPSKLVVGPLQGDRQEVVRDQTGPGIGSVSTALFEYRPDGAYLVSLRQQQSAGLQALDLKFTARSPQKFLPAFPQNGDSTSLTMTSGQVRLDAGLVVEDVGVDVKLGDGTTLRTVRFKTTSRIEGVSDQGTLKLNVTRTSWYSPVRRLEVKQTTDTTGRVGLCQVSTHIESLLQA